MRFRSNPMIRSGLTQEGAFDMSQGAMTVAGARNKTFALLGVLIVAFIASWALVISGVVAPTILAGVSVVAALVFALITSFKPHLASKTAMLYVIFEGLALGSISLVAEMMYPGMVLRTVVLTFLAVIFTLLLYREVPTLGGKIRKGVMIATLTIVGIYVMGFIFGLMGLPFIFAGSGTLSIVFSFVVVGVAAASLIVDYDNIAQGAAYGLPKQMEWFFAFGLMVTIVWLYIELLELLLKMASRD